MKKIIEKKYYIIPIAIIISLIFTANTSSAAIVPCGNGNDAANACTLCHLIIGIKKIVDFGLEILITIAAVCIFIAGLMYIMASGDENAITKAKSFLGASLKGFTIVLMAWFFVNVTIWLISKNEKLNIDQSKDSWYKFSCSTTSSAVPETK